MTIQRYRHKKRGSTYRIIHYGTMQCSTYVPYIDNEPVIIYQCEEDDKIWVRLEKEFFDGRFEKI